MADTAIHKRKLPRQRCVVVDLLGHVERAKLELIVETASEVWG